MRYIEASGGLCFGAPDGPQLDIVPLPGTRHDDLLSVARKALRSEPMAWESDRRYALMYPGWACVIGASRSSSLSVRLVYPPRTTALDALRAVEAFEAGVNTLTPVDACAALLVAARGLEQRIDANRISIAAMATAMATAKWENDAAQIGELPQPLSRRQIDDLAARVIETYPAIARPTDAARLALALAHDLWRPARLKRPNQPVEGIVGMSSIAALDLLLRSEPVVDVVGVRLRFSSSDVMLAAWRQVVEWMDAGITPDVLRTLAADGMFPDPGLSAYRDIGGEEQQALLSGLASSLLREADERAAYVPVGSFRLDVPDELTALREAGVQSLSVAVDARGIWFRPRGEEVGGISRWEPAVGVRQLVPQPAFAAWLHVVLAALWHDLRIAGKDAVPPSGEPTAPRAQSIEREPRRRSSSTRTLPALRLSGRRQWGTREEREAIARRAHGVRGFRRRLPPGWQRSEEALILARSFGVVLPDGFTFVRPHMRGARGEDNATETPREVVVRARGLASLITLLSE